MERIPEIYQNYLHERRAERLTGEQNGRLHTKADIARLITEGQGEWYVNRLNHRIPGFGKTFGEIASQVSDGNVLPERREPSLAESVIATRERQKEYSRVRETLLPRVTCLIKVGSTGWAENFDVRSGADPSDIDLEVIVEKPQKDLLKGLPEGEGMELFTDYYNQGKVDYFSYGYKAGDVPVSIHVMPKAFFEKNCNRDYTTLKHDRLAREFRVVPKTKPPIYHERYNGDGKQYPFVCKPELLPEGGQVTETPIMMIRDQKIVMGLIMSKYMPYPPVEGNSAFFEQNIETFKENLAQRLKAEGGGSFSKMPGRKDRMPYYILEQLDKEQAWLTKNY